MPASMADPVDFALADSMLSESFGARVKREFSMAPLTTFRIGGPAKFYLEPRDLEDLAAASRVVRETGLAYMVIGKGSNILVADKGFPGLVLRLGRGFRWVARDGHVLKAGGAMPLPALAGVAMQHGLSGMEWGVAIPASLGGAVMMNAGTDSGSVADVAREIEVFLMDDGEARSVPADGAGFSYRRSNFPSSAVVIGATLDLRPSDPDDIRLKMDEYREWRRKTQPVAEPNCGSVFKNPEGDFAARLIDSAGGKDLSIGGAVVSAKHANFIIAKSGATAADVHTLIGSVRDLVRETHGVDLEPEVKFIGRFVD